MSSSTEELTPVDLYLEQQKVMTPVARFSEEHDRNTLPEQEEYYRDLIPLSQPKAGEQYAFEVQLEQCTGCKACVTACHSLNGLDYGETWRDVGLVHGGTEAEPFQQTVTTACHHCVDPGCLNGCPVLAYEKDEATGIVVHLDDQCIGCQYCVLKCPYDVPKYNDSLGIVRKCDMCHERLGVGEAPACVQACPTEAIRITLVDTEAMAARVGEESFLPGAPEPSYTQPTTRYLSNRELPDNLEAADRYTLKAEEPHWPLVLMLSLTQMAVGAVTVEWVLSLLGMSSLASVLTLGVGLAALGVGMLASVTHLGKPLKAWRAFLGLKKSWLSREIVVFGAFGPLAGLYGGLKTLPLLTGQFEFLSSLPAVPVGIVQVVGLVTVASGLLGVFCSAMIYHDTQRRFWRLSLSGTKFFGTSLLLGLAAGMIGALGAQAGSGEALFAGSSLLLSVVLVGLLKLAFEFRFLGNVTATGYSSDKQSAETMIHCLRKPLVLRFSAGLLGSALFSALLYGQMTASGAAPWLGVIFAGFMLLSLVVGEIAERYLYFRAVVALKMPGGV